MRVAISKIAIHAKIKMEYFKVYPIYANSEKEKGLHGYSDNNIVLNKIDITVSGKPIEALLAWHYARFEKFFQK